MLLGVLSVLQEGDANIFVFGVLGVQRSTPTASSVVVSAGVSEVASTQRDMCCGETKVILWYPLIELLL